MLERTIRVRFDANVGPGLSWEFLPKQPTMEVRLGESAMAYAREYLEFHELTAQYQWRDGAPDEAVLHLGREQNVDMYILGGYGAPPAIEVVRGSTVDRILREADRPVIICR